LNINYLLFNITLKRSMFKNVDPDYWLHGLKMWLV
jgi:hypothetical protein